MIPHRFGAADPWTIGVEEELVFVDAATLEAAPVFGRVVGQPSERVKPELFECFVELATPVLDGAGEALATLRELRGEIAARAGPHGIAVHAAGMHALARGAGQPTVPLPHYERLLAHLGDTAYRQIVCGLHVHVSLPDPETCLRAFEGTVPWLPLVLALSANSPFAEGEDNGLRSERSRRLLELPTGGTPPVLGGWDDWSAAARSDPNRRHWDAWPRPEYGTLEVRIADQQTDVRRTGGIVALLQALVATAAGEEHETFDRALYARRRDEAARGPPDPAEPAALGRLVEPAARRLGGWELAAAVLSARPEAERQRDVAAAGGLREVVRDVVARTLE